MDFVDFDFLDSPRCNGTLIGNRMWPMHHCQWPWKSLFPIPSETARID